jgi:uncharacterized protein
MRTRERAWARNSLRIIAQGLRARLLTGLGVSSAMETAVYASGIVHAPLGRQRSMAEEQIALRRRMLMAAMACAGQKSFSPVQLQKMMFILDREIPDETGGPLYDFKPYDYGPFDRSIYSDLDALCVQGCVIREGEAFAPYRTYCLTDDGVAAGTGAYGILSKRAQDYVHSVVHFVRGQSFAGLVSAVYKAYPEMRENSVFRG